jgi:hypothetical protein
MAKDETWLVNDLRNALNHVSDARLRRAQLVVRPHPSNYKIYQAFTIPGVSCIPQKGMLPNTPVGLSVFYDSLHHAMAAVVGVNTSSVIETVIADIPVVALMTDYYRKTQSETQHFRQLLETNAVLCATTLDSAVTLLQELMDGHDKKKDARSAFVQKYIRPYGRNESAGMRAALELERAAMRASGIM